MDFGKIEKKENRPEIYDVIIVGAGASGLMAAIHAAKRGRSVLVIDHAKKPGKKLLVSGGGKCNITNRTIAVADYFGSDPAFCKYALRRYTPQATMEWLENAAIRTEERDHGRIFCRRGADQVVSCLVQAAEDAGARFLLNTTVSAIFYTTCFCLSCDGRQYESSALLVATGGLAWPQIGATNLGYAIARQFGHKIIALKPALTGFILPPEAPLMNLQGISLDVQLRIKGKNAVVEEPLLFTHKGISGPSVFQVSCFWEKDDVVLINFLPMGNVITWMHEPANGKLFVKNLLTQYLPERLVKAILPHTLSERKVAELGKTDRKTIADCVHSFPVIPASVEDFSKAEATLGGVNTDEINPKTMESRLQKGLFFSGEVIDITGKLGGYNIHWAFASGLLAGQNM